MFRQLIVAWALLVSVATQAQIPTESVDGTGLESVDGTGLESVDGTGTESVDGTGTESVDGTGLESVDGTGTESVDGTGLESVDGTGGSARSYVVKTGDTLGSIAEQLLGDASQWKKIYAANRGVISNANVVPVGVSLTIPSN